MLVLAGLLVSSVPGLPAPRLDPELVFLVFLPPVLWSAAFFASLRDFRANARPITLLAVGLVFVTALLVAWCARALIPGLGWPAALALGAIVSPPDAVSATSVVRALGAPRRVVTILEGESLLNDATALILYRAAVVAMVAGGFDPFASLLEFVAAAALGTAIGLAVGWFSRLAHRFTDDAPTVILLSLMAPYFAWLLAESVHASAVLACVVGGVTLRRGYSAEIAPRVRLQGRPVWDLVGFVINGVLFLLIGLQLRSLIRDVAPGGLARLIAVGLVISALAIVVRLVWVPLFAWVPRRMSRALRARDPMPSWQTLFLVGWAGLRGIVSLAAAMALPLTLADGAPVPFRSELILITFVVIFCTLVLQGLSLAPLIGWLRFPADDTPVREELAARTLAARSALARLDEIAAQPWAEPRTVALLREHYQDRLRRATEAASGDGAASLLAERGAKRARFESLLAERLALVRLRDEEKIGDEVLVALESELDLEAARHGLAELRGARGPARGHG
jgi:CPA1 family monovalent cation:H+ antiporter